MVALVAPLPMLPWTCEVSYRKICGLVCKEALEAISVMMAEVILFVILEVMRVLNSEVMGEVMRIVTYVQTHMETLDPTHGEICGATHAAINEVIRYHLLEICEATEMLRGAILGVPFSENHGHLCSSHPWKRVWTRHLYREAELPTAMHRRQIMKL
jgi:hypothetical protein